MNGFLMRYVVVSSGRPLSRRVRLSWNTADLSPVCLADKALKETLDQVLLSGYFDRIPSHQNGVCEEEEDEEPASAAVPAAAESSEAEEQTVDPGRDQRFPRVIPHRTLI